MTYEDADTTERDSDGQSPPIPPPRPPPIHPPHLPLKLPHPPHKNDKETRKQQERKELDGESREEDVRAQLCAFGVVGADGDSAPGGLNEERDHVGGEEDGHDAVGGDEEVVFAVEVAGETAEEDVVCCDEGAGLWR